MDDFVPWNKRSPENAEAHRRSRREVNARYYRNNVHRDKEWKRKYGIAYYQRNKGRRIQYNITRRRGIQQATICLQWLPQIEEFYKEARKLTEETGVNYVVDHIWPINGKGSCGLHVPWNLRVITQRENDSKGNTEPEDTWLSVTIEQEA